MVMSYGDLFNWCKQRHALVTFLGLSIAEKINVIFKRFTLATVCLWGLNLYNGDQLIVII